MLTTVDAPPSIAAVPVLIPAVPFPTGKTTLTPRSATPPAGDPGVTTSIHAPDRSPGHPVEPRRLGALGLVTVLFGAFLGVVDFFVVNVALPVIGTDLHASAASLQLVVAGYAIAYAVLLVLGGRLGDQFGRRRMFVIGIAVFTLTRLVCGLAPTVGILVAARFVQGAAAAFMVPQVLGTIQATTTGTHRARAIGAFGATAGLGMVVGQVLGGALLTADIAGTTWRPIFLVLVPFGVLGIVVARRVVPETRAERPARVDVAGTLLLAATLVALLVPLTEGRSFGWPVWTLVLLAAVVPLVAGFVLVELRGERRGDAPLVPPSLLRARSMRVGLTIAVPFFLGFGGFMFVFPLAVQQGAHLGPLAAGLALAPYAAVFLVVSLFVDRLVARFGRLVLVGGAVISGLGYVVTGVTAWLAWPDVTVAVLAVPSIVAGIGQACVMVPLFRVVLSDVPPDRAGTGSGVLTTTQQTSVALGVGALGTLFLTLDAIPSIGMRGAFALVLIGQVAVFAVVAALATRLPDPRR